MTTIEMPPAGLACPVPLPDTMLERVQLGHGSGGKMSARLLRERFLPRFDNPVLAQLGDAAVVPAYSGDVAISTDTFVVHPLEFPGGDIGMLAVHGTVNDVAMMGAEPRYLTAGFVLEEGLEFGVLDRVLTSMSEAARAAHVQIVSGDTKVVERGKADGLFINTTGFGLIDPSFRPRPDRARVDDAIIVSGPIGRHGIAVLRAREGLEFDAEIESDTANLSPLVQLLRREIGSAVHVLRDPTRGGVASALNEIAQASAVEMLLNDTQLPVPEPVAAACAMLGFDPLYVANEGILLALVAAPLADRAVTALQAHPLGRGARVIGEVTRRRDNGIVLLRTGLGGTRVVDMLPGDQLPRIC